MEQAGGAEADVLGADEVWDEIDAAAEEEAREVDTPDDETAWVDEGLS